MGKKVVSKVMWMGRATIFLTGLAVILAITVGLGTTALAAAPGDPFRLGKYNSVNKITKLVGKEARAMLSIDNNGGGTALDLSVEDGNAPMTVDSDEKVENLNADTVDGMSSDDLRGQKGDKGDKGDPGQSVTSEQIAADPNNENCPNGGSKFTSASGETFACTGADGEDGVDGEDGAPGAQGPAGPGVAAWARVAADGSVQGSSPGVTVRKEDGRPGLYVINIGRQAAGCAILATPNQARTQVATQNSSNPQEVTVVTINTQDDELADRPFSAAVFCN
jgi:hypothetical protein